MLMTIFKWLISLKIFYNQKRLMLEEMTREQLLSEMKFIEQKLGIYNKRMNLGDPESMTSKQRHEAIIKLINYVDDLCEYDHIPGKYIRIGKNKYREFINYTKQMKSKIDI